MEAADIDVLVVGREGNARYVSGAPRLWTAGSRAFGPGCVLVRATRRRPSAEHVGRGDPRRHPPREPVRDLVQRDELREGAAEDRRRRDRPDRCDRRHVTPSSAQLLPEGVPVGRARRRRAAAAPGSPGQDARGGRRHPCIGPRRRALRWARRRRRSRPASPSGSSRACSWRRWRRPASRLPRHRTWPGSRRAKHPWHRASRDAPVEPGDLVAFDAGVDPRRVRRRARPDPSRWTATSPSTASCPRRWDELWDRLLGGVPGRARR